MSDGSEQSAIVEPVERGIFYGIERPPGPAPIDDFCLEQIDDGFGQCVIIGASNAADGGARPASTRRSVYRMLTYWLSRSE